MSIFLENNTFFNTYNLRNSRIMLTHTIDSPSVYPHFSTFAYVRVKND